jgi:hypothetical protein
MNSATGRSRKTGPLQTAPTTSVAEGTDILVSTAPVFVADVARTGYAMEPASAGYTFDDLMVAWWAGYDYATAPERVAEFADVTDDIRHAQPVPPSRPYEERVAARVAEMEAFDVTAWLAEYRQRTREHDARVLAAAGVTR